MASKKQYAVPLNSVLNALDCKNRKFLRDLPDDERKKLSNFLMLNYMSAVEGDKDMQEYYLLSSQENCNTNFFELSKHPELQWLSLTAIGPGLGIQKHYWVGSVPNTPKNALYETVAALMPMAKQDEIELWLKVNQEQDILDWIQQHGMSVPKQKK